MKELLDWVKLLQAISLKVPKSSWSSVAGDIGVDRDTLSHICVRLLGRRLRTIGPGDHEQIFTRFLDAYGLRLLGVNRLETRPVRL